MYTGKNFTLYYVTRYRRLADSVYEEIARNEQPPILHGSDPVRGIHLPSRLVMQRDSIRRRTVNLIRAFHLINPNYAWRRAMATRRFCSTRARSTSLSLSLFASFSVFVLHARPYLNAPLIREYPSSPGGSLAPRAR